MPEETTGPDAEIEVEPAKKKSRKLPIMIALVMILILAGGGGFYYWKFLRPASQLRAATQAAAKKGSGGSHGKTEAAADGDADVTQVIELQPFIVNLADKNESRYLRMSISLGVGGEGGEAKADPLFTTKIRNAILATISTRTSDQILSVEGKSALRKDMLTAARAAASKPEVLTIYITDFIIQM